MNLLAKRNVALKNSWGWSMEWGHGEKKKGREGIQPQNGKTETKPRQYVAHGHQKPKNGLVAFQFSWSQYKVHPCHLPWRSVSHWERVLNWGTPYNVLSAEVSARKNIEGDKAATVEHRLTGKQFGHDTLSNRYPQNARIFHQVWKHQKNNITSLR